MGCLLVVVLDANVSIAVDAEIGDCHGGGRFLQVMKLGLGLIFLKVEDLGVEEPDLEVCFSIFLDIIKDSNSINFASHTPQLVAKATLTFILHLQVKF